MYIDAAEVMLEDDVASNRAIGSYGASSESDQFTFYAFIHLLMHGIICLLTLGGCTTL